LLLELLLDRGVALLTSRAWGHAGIVQSFQQIVHAVQAVLDAKLLLKNADHVLATQRADAVGLGRSGSSRVRNSGS